MNRVCALLAVTFFFPALYAAAQDTASLQGVVRDPNDALIRSASVTLTSTEKGTSKTFQTNRDGIYTFLYVLPGSYTLTVQANGFKTYIRTSLVLQTAEKSTADVRMTVGAAQETVDVFGDRLLLNDRDGSVGAVIDRTLVENIPLNGRSLQSLFTLVPGVTLAPNTSSPNVTSGQIIVNGQRAQSNQVMVDGVSANVPPGNGNNGNFSPNVFTVTAYGGTQGLATVDELEEFRVLTSTYSAEYGTSPGGQFMLTTRSGTKQLRGSAYEFFRNEILDSNNWFNNYNKFPKGKLPMKAR